MLQQTDRYLWDLRMYNDAVRIHLCGEKIWLAKIVELGSRLRFNSLSRISSNGLRTTFYDSASAAAGHRQPEAAWPASLESETPSQSRTRRDQCRGRQWDTGKCCKCMMVPWRMKVIQSLGPWHWHPAPTWSPAPAREIQAFWRARGKRSWRAELIWRKCWNTSTSLIRLGRVFLSVSLSFSDYIYFVCMCIYLEARIELVSFLERKSEKER